MINDRYPYALPPLPYAYNALEPYIDAETMHYHHDKHFQTYINNLNNALEKYPRLQRLTLEQLLRNPEALPPAARTAIINNGGGVYNHYRFFNNLAPADESMHQPIGAILGMINTSFGSFDRFKELFTKSALDVFGSGYTVLALTGHGKLAIVNVPNQNTVLPMNAKPVILFDVWEHAYYLKYKNLRADYIKGIWNVISFPVSASLL